MSRTLNRFDALDSGSESELEEEMQAEQQNMLPESPHADGTAVCDVIEEAQVAAETTPMAAQPVSTKTAWADMADSEDENDVQDAGIPPAVQTSSGDLEDSNDESDAKNGPLAAQTEPKVQWADLVDSDEEEEKVPTLLTITLGANAPDVVVEKKAQNVNDTPGSIAQRPSAWGAGRHQVRAATHGKGQGKAQNHKEVVGKGKGKAGKPENTAGKASGKGAGKPAAEANKGAWRGGEKGAGRGIKHQCQFIIGIEEDSKFRVMKRIIGTGGENVKRINESTKNDNDPQGAKLRLRGRGSKFLEGPEKKESKDDLMLCVTSWDAAGFEEAKVRVTELLEEVYEQYRDFLRTAGKRIPTLEIQIHDGAREGSR